MKNFKPVFFLVISLIFVFFDIIFVSPAFNKVNSQIQDTLDRDEQSLDSVKFYFDESRKESLIRDTAFVTIDGKVYRIPIKLNLIGISSLRSTYFELTGVSLYDNPELEFSLRDIFANPRKRLTQNLYEGDYSKYFEPYDTTTSEASKKNDLARIREGKSGESSRENYDFPLPETIDMVVDLRDPSNGVVTVLGIEFDYNKLGDRFQRYLLSLEKKYSK